MRSVIACLVTLSAVLASAPPARAQAGRYIPMPRLPSGGGGAGGHFFPHIPFHGGGNGDDSMIWVIAAIIGVSLLGFLGWQVGQAAGRRLRSPRGKPRSSSPQGPDVWQATALPMRDLILQSDEVADKADRTRRHMEVLAHRDHAFAASDLLEWIAKTFQLVQKAWEARDYVNVRDLLVPELLAKHQRLLASMRKNHEINRIENLRIERLEFVHLNYPRAVESHEVTALITFSASVYFVHDRTGAHTRGLRSSSWFQEFWTFRRQGDSWLLQTIEQSHESDRLERANFIAELREMEL